MRRLALILVAASVLAAPGLAGADPICPPTAEANSGGWSSVSGSPYPFEVWYQQTGGREEYLAQDMAYELKTTIWPKEVGVMGRPPVKDPRAGTGGRLQICLVPTLDDGNLGVTQPMPGFSAPDPTYMLLALYGEGTDRTEHQMRDALAHEFFHVLQHAFPNDGGAAGKWWREASANWAMDLTYPNDQGEQGYAHNFFDSYADLPGPSIDALSGLPSYGAYVFPFFLSHTLSNATVGRIWQLVGAGMGVPQAISAALGSGGLRGLWPQFMADNWNAPPLTAYRTWDKLPDGVSTHSIPDSVPLNQTRSLANLQLPHLSGRYFDERVPPDARSVTFINTDPFGAGPDDPYALPDAQVEAVTADPQTGQLQSRDTLTGKSGLANCFALTGQNVKQLLLIFSNSSPTLDFSDPSVQYSGPASVIVSNDGCGKWVGHFTAERDHADGTVEQTSGDVTFTLRPANPAPDEPSDYYVPTGGTIHWQISDPRCTYIPSTEDYPATESGLQLALGWNGSIQGADKYVIDDGYPIGRAVRLKRTCGTTTTTITWNQAYPILSSLTGQPYRTVGGGGLLLDGKNTWNNSGVWTDHWQWTFTSSG